MKKLILATLTITMLATMPARADDLARILGVIIGGAIVIESLNKPRTTVNNNTVIMPNYNPYNDPRRPGYARGLDDANRVCSIQPHYYQTYIETVYRNCYGDVIRVERTARY
jgi:hypothetical protein